MSNCTICPRKCGADREHGKTGLCGADNRILVSRVAPHYWEEPCISGTNGSGAVFFSGCPLGCVYCQNAEISKGNVGKEYTVKSLADAFLSLQEQKVHNINLVTPTHYVPQISKALDIASLHIPVVYNCGGYELPEMLDILNGKVQIYLPDFKYSSNELAKKYSRAENYPQITLKAIEHMLKQVGTAKFDDNDMMTSGVIVRHLVLPGYIEESMDALKILYEHFGDDIYISIMNQYTPMKNVPFDELKRPVTDKEYEQVLDFAENIGIVNGFIQEGGTVSESFIPDFDIK